MNRYNSFTSLGTAQGENADVYLSATFLKSITPSSSSIWLNVMFNCIEQSGVLEESLWFIQKTDEMREFDHATMMRRLVYFMEQEAIST